MADYFNAGMRLYLDHLVDWGEQTCSAFRLKMFPDDHFFVDRHRVPLVAAVANTLRTALT